MAKSKYGPRVTPVSEVLYDALDAKHQHVVVIAWGDDGNTIYTASNVENDGELWRLGMAKIKLDRLYDEEREKDRTFPREAIP